MYVIRDKIKYRAKVRTKSQSGNTGFTDGLLLVKFFQIAKDVRSIKENIEEIKATPQKQKLADTIKNTIKTDDEKQDKIMLFFNECSQLYKRCNSKEEFESKVEIIIAKYNKKGDFDYSTLKSGLWEQYKQL